MKNEYVYKVGPSEWEWSYRDTIEIECSNLEGDWVVDSTGQALNSVLGAWISDHQECYESDQCILVFDLHILGDAGEEYSPFDQSGHWCNQDIVVLACYLWHVDKVDQLPASFANAAGKALREHLLDIVYER